MCVLGKVTVEWWFFSRVTRAPLSSGKSIMPTKLTTNSWQLTFGRSIKSRLDISVNSLILVARWPEINHLKMREEDGKEDNVEWKWNLSWAPSGEEETHHRSRSKAKKSIVLILSPSLLSVRIFFIHLGPLGFAKFLWNSIFWQVWSRAREFTTLNNKHYKARTFLFSEKRNGKWKRRLICIGWRQWESFFGSKGRDEKKTQRQCLNHQPAIAPLCDTHFKVFIKEK